MHPGMPAHRAERRPDQPVGGQRSMSAARGLVALAVLGLVGVHLAQRSSQGRKALFLFADDAAAQQPLAGEGGIALMGDSIGRDPGPPRSAGAAGRDSSKALGGAIPPNVPDPPSRLAFPAAGAELSPYAHWTVVVTVSSGFDDMFNNWLAFYRRLALDSAILLVAEDSTTYTKYRGAPGITTVKGYEAARNDAAASEALDHKTEGYKRLVSKRSRHLLKALVAHPAVLYADIDAVWLADPRPFLTGESIDMWAGLDGHTFRGVERPFFCTGFMAMRDTRPVRRLLTEWDRQLTRKTDVNQMVFNDILVRGLPGPKIRIQALDSTLFPWGELYFEKLTPLQRRAVVVVHNNFVVGKERKIARFRAEGLWLVD